MFDNFFNFVKLPVGKEITSVVTFLSSVSGLSFFDGLFRFFNEERKNKWEKIVTEYYIDYLGKIEVVCYDWLGRVFALSDDTNTVIFFEPGTGKVYDTDAGIEKFFDYVVIEYTNDCFALDFFKEWFESTEGYQLLMRKLQDSIISKWSRFCREFRGVRHGSSLGNNESYA